MLILVKKGITINKYRGVEVLDLDYMKDLNHDELKEECIELEKCSRKSDKIALVGEDVSHDRLRWIIMASDVVIGF